MGLAWIVPGARLLLPFAFRADLQHAFGVVVTCEVSRRVRTMFAEPDPHLPPPDVKLQTFLLSAARASATVRSGFRASGLPQLRGIGRNGGHCVTCDRVMRLAG